MLTLELKHFQPRGENKFSETRKWLATSMPLVSAAFKKRPQEKLPYGHWVARVRTDLEAVPLNLREISMVAFAFTRPSINGKDINLMVNIFASHGGLGLDPQKMMAESNTGGASYGTNWIQRFYPVYSEPMLNNNLSMQYGFLKPDDIQHANNFKELFSKHANEQLAKAMNNIEMAFAL